MMEVEKFVGCLKDSSVEFFTGVPMKFLHGCYCMVKDVCSNETVSMN